jgi:tripartite-type tricarboxylate transporter receptor subunit TctC
MKLPHRRQFLHLAAGSAALPVVSCIAWAEAYPTRPITMVVPFPAGGGTDIVARILGERIRASLGASVIIENVSGAAGSIGVGRVARASPDGYTLIVGHWGTLVANGAIYSLPYDVLKDFEPISLVATMPYIVVARTTVPAKDLSSFISWLKDNPNSATQGTSGVGSPPHIFGAMFQAVSGTRYQFVPYRGAAPALQDLVAGQLDFIVADAGTSLEQVRAGTVKALAVTAKSRLRTAPNIPTVDEAGLPGLYASLWMGLWAPARTPKDVIDRLNGVVVDALGDPSVRSRLADLGQEPFPRQQLTPGALGAFQKAEIDKWWPIIKAANIKGE